MLKHEYFMESSQNFPSPLMTPNTIKTIEQSILASLNDSNPQITASSANGSFVPPLPSYWQGGEVKVIKNEEVIVEEEVVVKRKKKGRSKNVEEDERRVIRRERNKLAAARCRKRRVDHTNLLLEETSLLEQNRTHLQTQINKYTQKKTSLEYILQAHMTSCAIKPKRPTSLSVKPTTPPTTTTTTTGISITTPSSGLNIMNTFDIDWTDLPSTGLTPTATTTNLVTPGSCALILNSLNDKKFVSL